MNETDFYTNNFFLVEHTAQLLYDDSNHNIKEVRRIRLIYDHRSCIMYLDERFNDLEFRGFSGRLSPNTTGEIFSKNREDKLIDYLKDKYQELKNSDFRYKRGDGYEGDKTLYLEDFIEYLKIENRDKKIEKILENE
jgi:hypothetical protein